MSGQDPQDAERSSPHLREGLILLGFILVCLAATFSVAIPELREDDGKDASALAQTDAGTKDTVPE